MRNIIRILFGLSILLFTSCHHDDVDPIRFTDNISTVKVYADATDASITFEADKIWTASTTNDWITISTTSGSIGSSTLKATLAVNYTGTSRTGTVNILCDGNTYPVSIVQDAVDKSGNKPEPVPDLANRTVLAYIIAENSLSSFAQEDIDEMKQGIANNMPDNNNMLVYVDDTKNPRILRLYKSGTTARCDTVYQYTENKISTDPAVFQQVLNYTIDNYPAKNYGLVMWSHGDGWLPATQKVDTRMIGIDNGMDNTSNSGPEMDITDMASVLNTVIANKTKSKFDFILFDACFMQGVEVAYELRNCANYIVGSPTEIPGPGAPYQNMIAPFFATTFDANSMVNAYYNYYINDATYGAAISAFKCSEMENLAAATATALKTISDFTFSKGDVSYYCSAPSSSLPYYYDINSFMKKKLSDNNYATWKKSLDSAVPYKNTTPWVFSSYIYGKWNIDTTTYCGACFYLPKTTNKSTWNTYFKTLGWYSAAGWSSVNWQ